MSAIPGHKRIIVASKWRQPERCPGTQQFDTVSVLAFNTPHTFKAHFYIPLAGAVINTINPRLDEETIRYILSFAEAKVLIVDRQLLPQALAGIRYLKQHHPREVPVIVIDDPYADEAPDLPKDIAMHDYNRLLDT